LDRRNVPDVNDSPPLTRHTPYLFGPCERCYNQLINGYGNHEDKISVAILKEDELDIISHSPEQTHRLGTRLGALLYAGDVICLSGDMGAGKTVFSAGIGIGWGAFYPLTSPTFNLVHEHRREKDKLRLYHLDCYRLQGAQDIDSIGYDDVISGRGVVVIEWPERVIGSLPSERLWIQLRILDANRRNLIFSAVGQRYKDLIRHLRGVSFGV
jgi:tRNA threonylcarbamoyladenosine biosynthesis protein TsaE